MSYFTYRDHLAAPENEQFVRGKLIHLHRALSEHIRYQDFDLYPRVENTCFIGTSSAANPDGDAVLTLSYFRSREQAQLVEHLMGIHRSAALADSITPARHPVIELRLAPDHFAVELILSGYAWWDQRNLIGKLEHQRHVQGLRRMLGDMENDYAFGFWDGTYLSEMHLTTWQITQGNILQEWMDTFEETRDCLRIGIWYEPEDVALAEDNIVSEIFGRLCDLYQIYDFLLWSSSNNYHGFYEKRQQAIKRMYA